MANHTTCTFPGCERPFKGRGYCNAHLRQLRRRGWVGEIQIRRPDRGCRVPGCLRPHDSLGFCEMHYKRHQNNGDLRAPVRVTGSKLAFLDEVIAADPDPCLMLPDWFLRNNKGYGVLKIWRDNYAHRYVCRLVNGEPTADKPLALHRCGNGTKGCVTPRCLYWGDHSDNELDRIKHGRHNKAKLCFDDVQAIRASTDIIRVVAATYGVSERAIYRIRAGETYEWL